MAIDSIVNAYQATMPVQSNKTVDKAKDAASPNGASKAADIPAAKPQTVHSEGKTVSREENEEAMDALLKQEDIAQEKLKKSIDSINKQLNNTECRFGFHEQTNRVMIKIVDKETDKVLKEFPPEKTLEMIAKVWELAGILMDEKM